LTSANSKARELLKHRFIRTAGTTDSLQELIERREEWEARRGDRLSKIEMYNDEAVGTIVGDDDDPWVFATVRPGSSASIAEAASEIGTVKKISSPPAVHAPMNTTDV
jgi:serine/threonine-protein kinase 24/25/MST4